MIQVKDRKVLRALLHVPYDPILIDIVLWIIDTFKYATVTDGYRNGEGVHSIIPCRGLDLRDDEYGDPGYVVAEVNKRWGYDPDRPHLHCALWHEAEPGSGFHIHLQTHPNSYRKEDIE
jgi:hypothetical protein